VDGCEERAQPTRAAAGHCQARAVDLHCTQGLCASEEGKEVDNVLEDIMPGAGREEPIVCGDEYQTSCDRSLWVSRSHVRSRFADSK